jgi:hypothetical protein
MFEGFQPEKRTLSQGWALNLRQTFEDTPLTRLGYNNLLRELGKEADRTRANTR